MKAGCREQKGQGGPVTVAKQEDTPVAGEVASGPSFRRADTMESSALTRTHTYVAGSGMARDQVVGYQGHLSAASPQRKDLRNKCYEEQFGDVGVSDVELPGTCAGLHDDLGVGMDEVLDYDKEDLEEGVKGAWLSVPLNLPHERPRTVNGAEVCVLQATKKKGKSAPQTEKGLPAGQRASARIMTLKPGKMGLLDPKIDC
ncbi:hypothetical protein NDU88_002219 [Pleurodeles waltl]|uniref:Uncharacterized protein n=1 Tax=Pleurodeles waltl TaxID=8319 RepID=A0AAV7UAR5_PLEWA|nr:hypothetical protein NDU88_002219 [Pleurodeles waltl]